MSMKKISSLLISIILFLLSSCHGYGSWNFFYEGNDVDERTKSCKKLTDSDSDFAKSGISSLGNKYTVLVFTDTHFGSKKKDIKYQNLLDYLSTLKGSADYPAFAICLGDSAELGNQEDFDEYNKFCDLLISDYGLGLVLNVCGNHDIYQNHWDNWKANCYPYTSFYTFETKKFSWYCLDTASGTIGLNQYNKIKELFEKDSRPKIIFTHYPFTRFKYDCANMGESTERNILLSDFANNQVLCVLGGHNHIPSFDDLGFKDYGIPSFGYKESWGLMHVDEEKEDVYVELVTSH